MRPHVSAGVLPGDRHRGAAAVRPGSRGPEEHSPPGRPSAPAGGSSGAAYWDLDGLQQRLRHQPGQGRRAATVHVLHGLGSGCFHVSSFTPASVPPTWLKREAECTHPVFAGPAMDGGGCP